MKKLETNALRIAELMGTFMYNKFARLGQLMSERRGEEIRCIEYYSSYNGLMPIVFESKKSGLYTINILAVSVVFGTYDSMNEFETIHGKSFETDSEESFIEAIQECVIKYLELKND